MLVQPRKGHRAGMDAMMLAAAVPSFFSGRLADLGAGAGAAGLAAASRCARAEVVLVERSAEMADCARRTIAHPANSRLSGRARVLVADVTLTGKERSAAGMEDTSFDYVVMNPPFNAASDRGSPDELRRSAHVMHEDIFEKWLRTAAAITRPRGGLALIARPQSLREILDALQGRFGEAQIVPILPRIDEPAIRIVIRARRASRGGLTLMPPLAIHDPRGERFSARADDINNGRTSLFGD
ncbi:methyltransferase [Aquamicrobium sp. LC103]|uniref:tRNA1(Val) (adenine(37)-N6)-methyltransferase n=1 Tax=Aquamicrobium sp. LC103 TaxID=1120658 RepID=UPI0009E262C3|nr:methyltransferase [Aquamicrobium sp. LC103]TKT81465.1 methyltransferase [Aquamicrobium sp. LC103]